METASPHIDLVSSGRFQASGSSTGDCLCQRVLPIGHGYVLIMFPMRDTDIVWLHLSDWHQRGRDFDRVVVRDALIEDLCNRDRIASQLGRVDFIVFSGDLAFSGKAEEYETAGREFLAPVMSAVSLSRDRVFFVPGNHDIDRRDLEMLPPPLGSPQGPRDG